MRSSLPSSFAKIILIFCFAILAMSSAFAQDTSAEGFSASPPSSVGITLQGCRNDGSLNPANFPVVVGGTPYYICPDKMYTTGNLGKNWAELDNVPFRLIIKDNEKADGSTLPTYNVIVAGDHFDDPLPTQRVGYFVVSTPELDPGCGTILGCLASPPSTSLACSVTVVSSGGDRFATGITGGTFDTIYETLAISQPKGSTCVFDYYQTLAIGAHLFNGSNLQAYKFENANFSVGKQTVPLPVNPCTSNAPGCIPSPPPQVLSKTMDASQNQGNIWTVAKQAPASETFNSCDLKDTSRNLSVILTWTKTPGTQNMVTITTKVYEKNPSLVPLTVNVTDTIYAAAIPGGTATQVGTASASGVAVPANTTTLVLQDSATIDPTLYTTPYSDTANADIFDGGTQVGSLQASACLDPNNNQCTGILSQGAGTDDSADVTDSESITDTASALTFSVDSTDSGLGSFTYQSNPYLLGTQILGPLLWASGTSGSVSSSGSITFNKTVDLNPPGTATTGDLTDTATVTASDSQTVHSDSADVSISSAPVTKLTINKTIDQTSLTDLTFTFHVVLQGGNTDSATPQVTIKAGQTSGSIDVTTLAPGAYTVSEDTLAGWLPQQSQSVTLSTDNLCTNSVEFDNVHAQDLTVTKTATPTFTRTYNWLIAKSVTPAKVSQFGGTAVFNYTVTASLGTPAYTDSGWAVTGTITVHNPNPVDFTGVAVTESGITASAVADPNATCQVTNGGNVTVPANGTKDVSYSCSYSAAPASSSETNTANATWDGTKYGTANSSASGSKDFTFNTPNTTVNAQITVTDSFNGGAAITLGTVNALTTTTTPNINPLTDGGLTITSPSFGVFKYSRTINVPTSGCLTYPNTAKIVETGQTANASVQVCGGEKTGALTMGFWQNKNGQAIITGQAKTGVCPSATWLRQYAPFQDLSATATCAQVATYVYNVIKAANAGGAAMNAMLKAQMLATALDVYFSDPALGGNKIGAPGPIGNDPIDLTKVCNMIDSSGGTASCTGNPKYINTSAAFGGASSLTVSQLLTYAASQSNSGGSVWYGQNKTLQGLAKNTFDAINNDTAFAP